MTFELLGAEKEYFLLSCEVKFSFSEYFVRVGVLWWIAAYIKAAPLGVGGVCYALGESSLLSLEAAPADPMREYKKACSDLVNLFELLLSLLSLCPRLVSGAVSRSINNLVFMISDFFPDFFPILFFYSVNAYL